MQPSPISNNHLPSAILVKPTSVEVETLCLRVSDGRLVLDPEYQRSKFVWDLKDKSRLIESLLLGLPVPEIYCASLEGGTVEVIDGQQRLTAVTDFCKNSYALRDLEFLGQFNKMKFRDLTKEAQERIMQYSILMRVIPKVDPTWGSRLARTMFQRLNEGKPMTPAELFKGNADGPARDLISATAEAVQKITGKRGKKDKRSGAYSLAAAVLLGTRCQVVQDDLAWGGIHYKDGGNEQWNTMLHRISPAVNEMGLSERSALSADTSRTLQRSHAVFGVMTFKQGPRGKTSRVPALLQALTFQKGHDPTGRVPDQTILDAYESFCRARPSFSADRKVLVGLVGDWLTTVKSL